MKNPKIYLPWKNHECLIEYIVVTAHPYLLLDKKESYKEKHHVLPVSLSGKDKDNLILVEYKYHVYLHKLLYLGLRSNKMAYAYAMMQLSSKANGNQLEAKEAQRESLKQYHAENDNILYRFYHPEQGTVKFNKRGFSKHTGISLNTVGFIVRGVRKVHKKWILQETENPQGEWQEKKSLKALEKNNRYNHTMRTWYHDTYGTETLTGRQLADKYSLGAGRVLQVGRGHQWNAYGWRLTEEKLEQRGENHPVALKEKYNFYHPEHGDRYCIPSDIVKEFPQIGNSITHLISRKQKSYKGWSLKEVYEKSAYRFLHKEHGERKCTTRQLQSEFPGLGHIADVAKGKRKSCRGWRLA